MLEPRIYTPRSSFEAMREPSSFLTLPAELRVRIYEYTLSNIQVRPLCIKRYPGHSWLYRQPKHPIIPPVLLVNRQIYYEAREVLHKLCFSTTGQPIVIEHIHYDNSYRPILQPRDWNDLSAYRCVREMAPLLKSLPRIRLEVVLCGCFEDQVMTITLLRWIRAVLNSRPSSSLDSECHVPLQTLDVIYSVLSGQCWPKESDGIVRAVTGITTVTADPQACFIWSTERPGNCKERKMEDGHRLDISAGHSGVEGGEASAWEGIQKAWKRLQVDENVKIAQRERDRLDYLSPIYRLVVAGEKLVAMLRPW